MSALGRANQNASNPRGVSFGSVLGGNINACFYIQVALILPAKWEQEADLWADADRVTLEIAELCFRATSNALVRAASLDSPARPAQNSALATGDAFASDFQRTSFVRGYRNLHDVSPNNVKSPDRGALGRPFILLRLSSSSLKRSATSAA
jgi:hypothetical protein